MIVVGSVDEENMQEIMFIAKIFTVGQIVQKLSQQRRKNENNNKKENK